MPTIIDYRQQVERPNCTRQWNTTLYGDVCAVARRDMQWLFYCPVLIALNIISLLANTTIIAVCVKNMSRLRGTMILVAVADILYVITFSVYHIPLYLQDYYHIHWLQDWANYIAEEKRIFYLLYRICKTVSVWMVVLVVCERFSKMWKPRQWETVFRTWTIPLYYGCVLAVACLLWVPLSLIMNADKWFQCWVTPCKGAVPNTWYEGPAGEPKNDYYEKLMYILLGLHHQGGSLYLMADYGIPLTMMVIMLVLISLEKSRKQKIEKKEGIEIKTDYDEFNMVFSLIMFYVVIEASNFLAHEQDAEHNGQIKLVRVLTMSSSCYKFFVYYISGRDFRETFWNLCSCCKSNVEKSVQEEN